MRRGRTLSAVVMDDCGEEREMKKSEKEEKIVGLWEEYRELKRERREKEKEAEAMKEEEKAIEGELGILVPSNEALGGVFHKVYEKPSVRYSEAFSEVVRQLVPKTKAGKAEEIKEECTTVRVQHSFKGVEK